MRLILDFRFLLGAIGTAGFLVLAWLALLAIRARVSGWTTLAGSYRAHERPDGLEFPRQRARLNGCNFRRGVTVRTSTQGLYLELARPWRFRHPPLLVPWRHISGPRPETTLFGRRRQTLVLSERPEWTVRLDEVAALEAKQFLPFPRLPYRDAFSRGRPPAPDAQIPSGPRGPARASVGQAQPGERPTPAPAGSGQWIVTCICGWTTQVPSDVAAGAAVIVHRREAQSDAEHLMAYCRYHDPRSRRVQIPVGQPQNRKPGAAAPVEHRSDEVLPRVPGLPRYRAVTARQASTR